MNGPSFARKRAIILYRARSERFARKAIAHLVREAGARAIYRSGKLVGHRMPDGFMVCEKRRYRSAIEANAELVNVRMFASLQVGKTPSRAYLCTHCKGWHVTSKPLRH